MGCTCAPQVRSARCRLCLSTPLAPHRAGGVPGPSSTWVGGPCCLVALNTGSQCRVPVGGAARPCKHPGRHPPTPGYTPPLFVVGSCYWAKARPHNKNYFKKSKTKVDPPKGDLTVGGFEPARRPRGPITTAHPQTKQFPNSPRTMRSKPDHISNPQQRSKIPTGKQKQIAPTDTVTQDLHQCQPQGHNAQAILCTTQRSAIRSNGTGKPRSRNASTGPVPATLTCNRNSQGLTPNDVIHAEST